MFRSRTICGQYVLHDACKLLQYQLIYLTAKPPPNFATQSMSSVVKAGLQQQPAPRPPAPTLPPIRYAAAAAAAVAQQVSTPSATVVSATLIPLSPAASHPPPSLVAPSIATPTSYHFSQDAVTSSPSLTQLSVTSPVLSSAASVSQQLDGSFYSGQESPAVSEANAISISSSVRKGLHDQLVYPEICNLILHRANIIAFGPEPCAEFYCVYYVHSCCNLLWLIQVMKACLCCRLKPFRAASIQRSSSNCLATATNARSIPSTSAASTTRAKVEVPSTRTAAVDVPTRCEGPSDRAAATAGHWHTPGAATNYWHPTSFFHAPASITTSCIGSRSIPRILVRFGCVFRECETERWSRFLNVF